MGAFEALDRVITDTVSSWNLYSTGLVTIAVLLVSYSITTARDPDTHPMLLAKQALPSPVRNEGESAIYRSHSAPHSMPLNSGLNVKDPGANKWARGRDGDLRDVWRKVVQGDENGGKGKLLTVLGKENVIDHKIEDVTRQINLIGQHIEEHGGIRVAVYLPNSVELLVTLFACSFYKNLTTVLIPFDVSGDELVSMLRRSAVDTVVTAPGSFPFDDVVKAYPSLRQLIWVTDEGSSHMDWDDVPEGSGGSVNVATWSEIMRDAPASAGLELPPQDPENPPQDVVMFWQGKQGQMEEMVRFSQANLAAGIAGQIFAIPAGHKLSPADLFLPADALTNAHTLVLTLTALWQNSSVALNSVAGNSPDLILATQGIAPTVIVASPQTLKSTHQESVGKLTSALASLSHSISSKSLIQQGIFPTSNPLSAFAAASKPPVGTTPGKLRLVYVADRAGAGTPQLSARELSDLRVFTGARIIYALAGPKVAGTVTQTAFYDYRVSGDEKGHFGPPLSCTEVLLKDKGQYKTTDEKREGEIYVRGPCVVGGEAGLGVVGKLLADNTLAYI